MVGESVLKNLMNADEYPLTSYQESLISRKNNEERQIYDFNNTKTEYTKKTIHQLFEEQVEKTPDNVAIVFGDNKLTYKEINNKANSLARLLRKKGTKTDSIVAIMAERSIEMVVGMIAVLKAGGAYLSIDPEYPRARISYMLKDSGASIALVDNLQMTVDIVGNSNMSSLQVIYLKDESCYCSDGSNLEQKKAK